MLWSLALIVFAGFVFGGVLQRYRLPPLLGMMVAGMLLGPSQLDAIHPAILGVSAELRQIALVVILIRAGLALDLRDLKRVGRPAVLLCFLPATMELFAVVLLAPPLLGLSRPEAALLGAILAAVSPAVVVPRMLQLMESGYGREQGVPQLVLAGASVDDIYVIVLFTALIGMSGGQGFDGRSLWGIPVSIALGLLLGVLAGNGVAWVFRAVHMRDTVKVLLLLGLSFLFLSLEEAIHPAVPFSGLPAVMAMGGAILSTYPALAERISGKYSKIWVAAELMLFVLVGAAVDIRLLQHAGAAAVLLVLAGLLVRMVGVFLCLWGTCLNGRERLFTAIAYLPKATVQAAIGAVPLSLGMEAGGTILAVAVLAIVIAAPLGAVGIDRTYAGLLQKSGGVREHSAEPPALRIPTHPIE